MTMDTGAKITESRTKVVTQYVDENGEAGLLFVTYRPLPCGCEATGNGTLQHPFTVKHCEAHAAETAH